MKADNALVVAIIAAGILLASMGMPAQEQHAPHRLGSTVTASASAPSPAVPDEQLYFTNNGMVVKLGRINSREAKEAPLFLVSEDKTLRFDISLGANRTYTYLQLDGMLVVPKESVLIDQQETSFYTEGNELVVSLNGSARTLWVYTGRKGRPSLVVPGSVSWDYDEQARLLTITGRVPEKLFVFWDGYDSTTFLEDTVRLEDLKASVSSRRAAQFDLRTSIAGRTEALGQVRDELVALHDEVEQRRADIASLESRYGDLKSRNDEANANLFMEAEKVRAAEQNVSALDSRITANVLFEPRAVAIALIISFIAIVLIADALFFVPRVKK